MFFQNSAGNQHDGLLEIEGLDLPRVHFGNPEEPAPQLAASRRSCLLAEVLQPKDADIGS
jgi:hypothetical protein